MRGEYKGLINTDTLQLAAGGFIFPQVLVVVLMMYESFLQALAKPEPNPGGVLRQPMGRWWVSRFSKRLSVWSVGVSQ